MKMEHLIIRLAVYYGNLDASTEELQIEGFTAQKLKKLYGLKNAATMPPQDNYAANKSIASLIQANPNILSANRMTVILRDALKNRENFTQPLPTIQAIAKRNVTLPIFLRERALKIIVLVKGCANKVRPGAISAQNQRAQLIDLQHVFQILCQTYHASRESTVVDSDRSKQKKLNAVTHLMGDKTGEAPTWWSANTGQLGIFKEAHNALRGLKGRLIRHYNRAAAGYAGGFSAVAIVPKFPSLEKTWEENNSAETEPQAEASPHLPGNEVR